MSWSFWYDCVPTAIKMTSPRRYSRELLVVPVVLLVLALPSSAVDVPPAPSGFAWQEVPELKAAFLKPNGWFYRQESQEGTFAVFITKEDISKGGEFQTGMSLNVFHLKKDPTVERGKYMIESMAKAKHAEMWTRSVGPFQEFGCQVEDTDATGAIIMHALAVANPKTNTLYYFTYESPESEWDNAWKTGKQIMDMLALDDEM
jgi:hypothetical protein